MAVTNNNWSELIMTAAADAVTGRLKIKYIRWDQIGTAADDLVVSDTAGAKKRTIKAETDALPVEIPIDDMWDGFKVVTLDSGTVRVYLE